MAKLSDWCDTAKVEAAFRRGCKSGAASAAKDGEATLSALQKFLPKENFSNIQISFAGVARDKKYLPVSKFLTCEFFLKMCNGDEAKAKKLAKKIEEGEDAAVAKAAAPKKGGNSVTDRLTDAKSYTGSHKERFDDSGKGKGKSGRVDEAKNTGYVGEYKGDGTYTGAKK